MNKNTKLLFVENGQVTLNPDLTYQTNDLLDMLLAVIGAIGEAQLKETGETSTDFLSKVLAISARGKEELILEKNWKMALFYNGDLSMYGGCYFLCASTLIVIHDRIIENMIKENKSITGFGVSELFFSLSSYELDCSNMFRTITKKENK